MKLRAWGAAAAYAFLLVAACDTGQSAVTGIGEPIQVAKAQFIQGDLPGIPVPKGDAGTHETADGGPLPLSVLTLNFNNTLVPPGESGDSFTGDITADAAAIGVRLAGVGTGYWVVPAGPPDTALTDALTFSVSATFALSVPPGLYELEFVAISASGTAGQQTELQVCVESRIPDNGHSCSPSKAPPPAVFSLQWDTNFDLDLHVLAPGGVEYDPKMPAGQLPEAGAQALPAGAPFLDRDSLRNCVPDGLRQEDLVFPKGLTKGYYEIYVDPFAACGQAAVHFTLTVYQTAGNCPACELRASSTTSGELLASEVTGGVAPPLFVKELIVK